MRYAVPITVVLCFCAFLAYGQAPERVNCQGRLVNGTNLVNGSAQIVFRLFNTETGGAEIYGETQTVTIVNGIYSTMIGASNPAPGSLRTVLQSSPVFVEVAIDGTTMSPRERMTAVNSAISTLNANLLGGHCATQFVESINVDGALYRENIAIQGIGCIGAAAGSSNIYLFPIEQIATGMPLYAEQDPIYTNAFASGIIATGSPIYVEIDPTWGPASNLYYLRTQADAKFATNTPLYGGDTETDPIWTNALRRGFTEEGPVTNFSYYGIALRSGYNFYIMKGPSHLAIGTNASATGTTWSSVAIGDNASANYGDGGVAIGHDAQGDHNGIAVGFRCFGSDTNIALGHKACATGGVNRIAIGCTITNKVDNSCAIRGTMYLDQGTGVLYRSTFGRGSWRAKAFTIDHPLDPEHKVLRHFCLESPQVWNVYTGIAKLEDGVAVVALPDYYTALNLVGSEVYTLTAVGAPAAVWIKEEVTRNQFVIAGSEDVEVAWDVKVSRNDPGCLADLRQRPVEQFKTEINP